MNGLRPEFSIINSNNIRNPYRFCYCSSYDRGLELILTKIWPIIYNNNNMAELHVYYGMDHLDSESQKVLQFLLGQKGVMDHGRQPLEAIIREKQMSTFHMYLSTSIAEIDCISVRESIMCGCIPIISDFGVFKERHGLMYSIHDSLLEKIAMDIVIKMNDNTFIENSRNMLLKSDTIISWEKIAKMWYKYF